MVVTSAGDTLKGFIDHQEWLQNPGAITFKSTETSTTEQKFTPANSVYVEVLGIEAYQSARVSISQAPVDLSSLTHGADTTSVQDTVFLKVTHAGPSVSLFTYKDKIKLRFYLKEHTAGTPYQELLYRRYFKVGQAEYVATDPLYRNQLWALAIRYQGNSQGLLNKIKTSDYAKNDLLPLVRQINGPETKQASAVPFKKLPRTRFMLGLWLNRATMTNDKEQLVGAQEFSSYLPKFSLGIDAFANPATQRLLLRTEFSVSMAAPRVQHEVQKGSSSTYVYQYEYKQLSASLNPQVLYNLYNRDNFKVHLAAGLIATKASYSKDKFTTTYNIVPGEVSTAAILENYEQPETFWYSYTARAGMMLFNNLDVSLLYTTNNISRRVDYAINTQSISAGVSYLFARKVN
ncbi:hypothetical protein EFB08_09070 [Rufibacter latericius]|uniref:Outer membrane protein beta-barrel domain-containing protein n=1 Tax=Rufibacter latericius TaxID=2487040 RepID=A0A3M9MTF0_9BACT|nr:hypothetical protein EFB08_09070 [Rufibacter latericius]